MDKIYSRRRLNIDKFKKKKNINNERISKISKIAVIMIIAIITCNIIIKSITPIIETQCRNGTKSIATKISNQQATIVMGNYKYQDLCNVEKDSNGNITMISANVIPINEIISDIAIRIQDEFNKTENSSFNIKLGTLTGAKILSGRGPNVHIKMSTIGNLDTDLRSEFITAGINQTIHKIYLQVECNVIILTPFNTIEERISNQVLLAEAVIVGTTPNTYYNFEGIKKDDVIEIVE